MAQESTLSQDLTQQGANEGLHYTGHGLPYIMPAHYKICITPLDEFLRVNESFV